MEPTRTRRFTRIAAAANPGTAYDTARMGTKEPSKSVDRRCANTNNKKKRHGCAAVSHAYSDTAPDAYIKRTAYVLVAINKLSSANSGDHQVGGTPSDDAIQPPSTATDAKVPMD